MYIYNITTTITTILNQEKKSINAYRSFIMKPYKGKKLFDFPSERQNQNRRAGRFFSQDYSMENQTLKSLIMQIGCKKYENSTTISTPNIH